MYNIHVMCYIRWNVSGIVWSTLFYIELNCKYRFILKRKNLNVVIYIHIQKFEHYFQGPFNPFEILFGDDGVGMHSKYFSSDYIHLADNRVSAFKDSFNIKFYTQFIFLILNYCRVIYNQLIINNSTHDGK